MDLREISRAAFITALGLALPMVFHAVRLGHVFLPMYLPLLTGGFLLSPRWAAGVGFATPLISGVAFGMPPIFPPMAFWMALELGAMCGFIAFVNRRSRWPAPLLLAVSLAAGRVLFLVLVYLTAQWLALPPRLLTLAALLAGWPGMILAMFVVPAAVTLARRLTPSLLPEPRP